MPTYDYPSNRLETLEQVLRQYGLNLASSQRGQDIKRNGKPALGYYSLGKLTVFGEYMEDPAIVNSLRDLSIVQ